MFPLSIRTLSYIFLNDHSFYTISSIINIDVGIFKKKSVFKIETKKIRDPLKKKKKILV